MSRVTGPRTGPKTGPSWTRERTGGENSSLQDGASPHTRLKPSGASGEVVKLPRVEYFVLVARGAAARAIGRAARLSSPGIGTTWDLRLPAARYRAWTMSCGFPLPGTMMPVS